MGVRIGGTVPWKIKEAIKLLVKADFYNNESEFVAKAVLEAIEQEVKQGKFTWSQVTPEAAVENKEKHGQ